MPLLGGKRQNPALEAPSAGPGLERRLHVYDKMTQREYLVDTGAELSLIYPTRADRLQQPDLGYLRAANGTPIAVYGTKSLTLDLGLRRNFSWNFLIADVPVPMLGADFLQKYGLLIDMKGRKLVDSSTTLSTTGKERHVPVQSSTFSIAVEGTYGELLEDFPLLISPLQDNQEIQHDVTHHIVTNGPTEATKAFEDSEKILADVTLLSQFDSTAEISIATDASDVSVGAVLQHLQDNC